MLAAPIKVMFVFCLSAQEMDMNITFITYSPSHTIVQYGEMLRAVVESTLSQRPLLMAVYSRVYVVCAMFFMLSLMLRYHVNCTSGGYSK